MSKARAGEAAKPAIPQRTKTKPRYLMESPEAALASAEAEHTPILPAEEGRKHGNNGEI
jgi:hypothetical protein